MGCGRKAPRSPSFCLVSSMNRALSVFFDVWNASLYLTIAFVSPLILLVTVSGFITCHRVDAPERSFFRCFMKRTSMVREMLKPCTGSFDRDCKGIVLSPNSVLSCLRAP